MNTSLVTWNPFEDMEQISNRMATLWPSRFERNVDGTEKTRALAAWAPPCDILEEQNVYRIAVDLPGLDKNDVAVSIEDATLYLKGERNVERTAEGTRYHTTERPAGRFQRSFSLPKDVDTSTITAEFKNGVLNVTIEKRADARPRLIDVKVMYRSESSFLGCFAAIADQPTLAQSRGLESGVEESGRRDRGNQRTDLMSRVGARSNAIALIL